MLYVIEEKGRGYISKYYYRGLREPAYRAKAWAKRENVERFLGTASFRAIASHARNDFIIRRARRTGDKLIVGDPVRTIPLAELQTIAETRTQEIKARTAATRAKNRA